MFVVHVHVAQSIEELVGSDLQSVSKRCREIEREGERVCEGKREKSM